jgi:Tol biopolymer transport system component
VRRRGLATVACALSAASATLAAGAATIVPDAPYDYFPQWSPDGKRIAFERDGQLTIVDASGSRLRRLPGGMPADISEEGWVVFAGQQAGGDHLVALTR